MPTRALIRSFVEAAPNLAWANSPDGTTLFVNSRFTEYSGYSAQELLENIWLLLVHPEDRAAALELRQESIGLQKAYCIELRFRRANGSYCWHSTHVAPVRDAAGEVVAWFGTAIDIHDRKQAEDAVRKSEQRFRSLIEASSQIVWSCAPSGEQLQSQPAWQAFTGQTDEELLGQGWLDSVHPDDRSAGRESWERCVITHEIFDVEYRVRRHDGVWRWMHVRAAPVFDAAGKLCEWIGANADITERKQSEQALRESEAQFQMLANSIPQLAWMADSTGSIFWYNQRWYDFTGTTLEEMKGWGWGKVHHPEHVKRVIESIAGAFAGGERWEDTFPLRSRDGGWRWFLSRAVPMRDTEGRIVRWFGTNTDITHQREVEQSLRHSNEDLQQFSYVVSHDLQEPLRQVTVCSQMLAQMYPSAEGEAQQLCNYVSAGTKRMNTIIRDLLLMASPERDVPVECFESAEVVQDAVAAVQHHLDETGGHIVVDSALPKVVAARPVVRQAFQNLLSNAIKYRKEDLPPKIHIQGRRSGSEWTFSVSDNGQGVPADYKDRLFHWFSRAPGNKASGNGIGLASIERMLERVGGRIWVESEFGCGSTFHFAVPATIEPEDC